jgi:hypothetical protein
MIKNTIAAIVCCLWGGSVWAQNELDGLRFAKNKPLSTGRSMGVAGALGAVGADPAAITINPAALGMYRKNEFNTSLNFSNPITESNYLDEYYLQSFFNGNISNFSLIISNQLYQKGKDPDNDIVGYSFSFQYNRGHNYYNNTYYEGRNTASSILDMFWENAQGYTINELGSLEYLAHYVNLLPSKNGFDTWGITLEDNNRNLIQSGQIITKGGIADYSFGAALNFGNKFYAGASLLANRMTYVERTSFREDNILFEEGFSALEIASDIRSVGVGTGIKGGFIANLTDELRFGVSFNTPVTLKITDVYSYRMNASFSPLSSRYPGASNYEGQEGPYTFKYATTSPSRTTFSLSYVTGRWGFLSLDLERVNYRTILMGSDFSSFLNENRRINKDFRSVTNARLGMELINGDFRIRGGVSHSPSPYNRSLEIYKEEQKEWNFSAGIGLRKRNYGLDFGIMRSFHNSLFVPYLTMDPDYPSYSVNRRINTIHFIASFSYFFQEE